MYRCSARRRRTHGSWTRTGTARWASDRNPTPGTREAIGRDFVRQIARAGQSPAQVAQQVFDAIVAQRFYVLTHPEHNGVITKRAEAMISGGAPPAVGVA